MLGTVHFGGLYISSAYFLHRPGLMCDSPHLSFYLLVEKCSHQFVPFTIDCLLLILFYQTNSIFFSIHASTACREMFSNSLLACREVFSSVCYPQPTPVAGCQPVGGSRSDKNMDKLALRTFFHDVNYDAIMSMPVSFIYPVHCSGVSFKIYHPTVAVPHDKWRQINSWFLK